MYFKPPYLRFEGVNNNGVRSLLSHLRKRGGEAESRQVKHSMIKRCGEISKIKMLDTTYK